MSSPFGEPAARHLSDFFLAEATPSTSGTDSTLRFAVWQSIFAQHLTLGIFLVSSRLIVNRIFRSILLSSCGHVVWNVMTLHCVPQAVDQDGVCLV